MPDLARTHEVLRRYLNARVPLIVVRSIEPGRVLDSISALAGELRTMAFFEHSRTEGLVEMTSRQSVAEDFSLPGALEHARSTFKARTNANFVFPDVEDIEDESSTSRHMAEMVRLAETRQGSIVLVAAKPVWSGLRRLGMSVTLDLPTVDEMFDTLNGMIDDHRGVVATSWQHDDVRRAAETLVGITEGEAINILATLLTKGSLVPDDVAELSQFKESIFGELAGLERVRLRDGYVIGGLRNLRSWLARKEYAMKADLSDSHLRPPKGVLLVGVPGCGKSLSAKAIAAQWHLPLYRLDMAGILGMYVGQSESRLREALDTADRVAPCVLWIDEIEKALATGGGDAGTSRRLIGQFLFWLQESTSKVFVVATANDVSSLPPELLRKGRFDEMFFVDLPDAQDREEILRLYFSTYLGAEIAPALCGDLVDSTEGFAASDIDAVIHDVAWAMRESGRQAIPGDDELREFFSNVVPYSVTNAEDLAAIRNWGRTRAVPAGTPSSDGIPLASGDRRRVVVL
ncbi:ATPase [Dietzia natronolimnaea]|uniref:Uncharacterized AAA domain-containing protein ycf46 n=1 Tax=Dietzia natronolimnaea TaxID=161920 RepID=A0A2A2WQ53_9ACTN|nr:AAA family ATPase [Dietzia natronolimnaea]PAY23342.1 ATPase [Dietzia natronolimnaea]